MGTASAKIFGDMILVNKTLKTLDVSDNSFGKPAVGDQVKLKSSGWWEMKTVIQVWTKDKIRFEGSDGHPKASQGFIQSQEYKWESQVPALCAGVAASQSLISVSDFLTCTSCFFSHTRSVFCYVLSSTFLVIRLAKPEVRPWQRP